MISLANAVATFLSHGGNRNEKSHIVEEESNHNFWLFVSPILFGAICRNQEMK